MRTVTLICRSNWTRLTVIVELAQRVPTLAAGEVHFDAVGLGHVDDLSVIALTSSREYIGVFRKRPRHEERARICAEDYSGVRRLSRDGNAGGDRNS